MSEPETDPTFATLRSVIDRADPVPPAVIAAAKASFTWRTIDSELAELVADSAESLSAGAGRGRCTRRNRTATAHLRSRWPGCRSRSRRVGCPSSSRRPARPHDRRRGSRALEHGLDIDDRRRPRQIRRQRRPGRPRQPRRPATDRRQAGTDKLGLRLTRMQERISCVWITPLVSNVCSAEITRFRRSTGSSGNGTLIRRDQLLVLGRDAGCHPRARRPLGSRP